MSTPESYEHVEMSWVGDWAGRRAALTPRREALVDSATGLRLTYAQIDDRANRVGTFLADSLGLARGDKIAVICRNRVEQVDLYLACGKLGCILAPLSYRLKKPELDDLLRRIQPQALVYEACFAELVASLSLPPALRHQIRVDDTGGRWEEILATPPRPINRPKAMRDVFLYVHTGGSTAVPKVCQVTFRQMIWNAFEILANALDGMGNTVELLTFPMFHVGGWNTFTPVFHGGGKVVMMRDFDPGLLLRLIEQERVTHFGGVEAMLAFVLAHPRFKQTRLDSLSAITTAGAPCAPATMQPFWDLGIPVSQTYGMTEAGPSNFAYVCDGTTREEMIAHADAIGASMFHCDHKIVDPESRQELPDGQPGVLCMRSAHNFDGYLDDPARTAAVLLDGAWIYSGDLAVRDPDGNVRIVGRADNMFISGGENVSPEEIEQALQRHPAVAGAVCVGVPDPRWGQVGAAVVCFHAGQETSEEALREHCRAHLAGFKVPRRIQAVPALPLTGAGKLDRKAVRELLAQD